MVAKELLGRRVDTAMLTDEDTELWTSSTPKTRGGAVMVDGANLIDGRWVPAASGSTFQRCNPADPDDVVGTFPASGPADVRAAVDALDKAAPQWADLRPSGEPQSWNLRRHSWNQAGVLIAELVREEGKTTAEATMEVSRTPANLRFYAGEATEPQVRPTRPPVPTWCSHCGNPSDRRRDHAVELPAQHSVTQARSRARRR